MPEGPLRDEAGTPARALRFFILARRPSLALPCRPRPCLAVSGARGLAPSLAHSEYEINPRCAESDSFPMAPESPHLSHQGSRQQGIWLCGLGQTVERLRTAEAGVRQVPGPCVEPSP